MLGDLLADMIKNMKRLLPTLGLVLLGHAALGANITVGSWTPLYKGIEIASGQQQPTTGTEQLQQVLCLRVDLTDPDIALFTTPACTNCGGYETLSENTSLFLEHYGLQVAVNGGFYTSSAGGADSPLGTPEDVYGLAISRGKVVSLADDPAYVATMLFSTNNTAFFVPTNSPATNTTGIYTAVSGNHPLLIRSNNVNASVANDLDPRTAVGLSQNRRYLFLLTIDGRQSGWSDGADFHDTGEWLKRFGAYDGINVDGGGSTTMTVADCVGHAVRLNRSSYVAAYGRERNTGHNFGIYAKPLPSDLKNLNVDPSPTTTTLTWGTDLPTTTQVAYGLTTNYGSTTPLQTRLTRKHVATLAGLTPGSTYYFRASSTASGLTFTQACQFTAPFPSLVTTQVFDLPKVWSYATNNLDGVAWKAPGYNEAGWLGQGPGLLYVEDAAYVWPKNTVMPPTFNQSIPTTYYFRTHFDFSGSLTGGSLTLSNYVDDGAVFYLNGAELYRLRMTAAPAVIANSTLAIGSACKGDTHGYAGDAANVCPDVFTVSGGILTNVVQGDNVLAVEVHNYSTGSKDVVFGSALLLSASVTVHPQLHLWLEDGWATCFWNGTGFTLQQSTDLAQADSWTNVPGPVTQSPFSLIHNDTTFYRLKR